MSEQLTTEELAALMARIQEDPTAWAFCLASGAMQWVANFGMMSAKRRAFRAWVVAVQSSLLTGLVELATEPAAGRWRAAFEQAERTLAELGIDDAEIQTTIEAVRKQLSDARAVKI